LQEPLPYRNPANFCEHFEKYTASELNLPYSNVELFISKKQEKNTFKKPFPFFSFKKYGLEPKQKPIFV
jgi:hypothetical protein